MLELAGFVSGLVGIGLALRLLYRRARSRVVRRVYGQTGRRQGA